MTGNPIYLTSHLTSQMEHDSIEYRYEFALQGSANYATWKNGSELP